MKLAKTIITAALLLAAAITTKAQSIVATVPGWTHGNSGDYVFHYPSRTYVSSWFAYDVYEWQPGHPIWGLSGWYADMPMGAWNDTASIEIVVINFVDRYSNYGLGTPGYIEAWIGGQWVSASAPRPNNGVKWCVLKFKNTGSSVSAELVSAGYDSWNIPSTPSQIEQWVY